MKTPEKTADSVSTLLTRVKIQNENFELSSALLELYKNFLTFDYCINLMADNVCEKILCRFLLNRKTL